MKVTLLHNTPLWINAHGARTCWASGDKSDTESVWFCSNCEMETVESLPKQDVPHCDECGSTEMTMIYGSCGPKDRDLIDRVGNKFRHASILEHVSYNFYIEGISRAVLQELARHRIASLSVKSTRYTLKELKEEQPFYTTMWDEDAGENITVLDYRRADKYLVLTGVKWVDWASYKALENLREVLAMGISNDKAKYCMPESYKTELTWSINMRSMQNFLFLRSDKTALWEIRLMAEAVYNSLPEEHKYLYNNSIRFPSEEDNA